MKNAETICYKKYNTCSEKKAFKAIKMYVFKNFFWNRYSVAQYMLNDDYLLLYDWQSTVCIFRNCSYFVLHGKYILYYLYVKYIKTLDLI